MIQQFHFWVFSTWKKKQKQKQLTNPKIYILRSTEVLFPITNIWKQLKWMDKKDYIYNEKLLSPKKNEILSFTTTWTERDYAKQINQTEKGKYCMISLICGSK